MKKLLTALAFLLATLPAALAQKIQSPSEFLGYKLGDNFTPHYRVVEYYKYVASVSKNVKLVEYGKTYENRPLLLAFVSSEQNMGQLEDIRKSNLRLAGLESGQAMDSQPAIVWLSYNVHGNESVSTEASLQTFYDLVDPANARSREWLKNTVVIIDPCLNPDGRERYVNFYNVSKNLVPDPAPYTREHIEPWPGGRSNHYYFDLNRDWAWQSQTETRQRIKVYNQWLPQVHVDFHEQGINDPYYFAPAAEPFHEDITAWQREFQTIIGKNHAKYFDENGWLYFTKERFDLLYPSYGDTYPTYNGSVGMTYEQGGSGRAGLAVLNAEGDTLTLKDRIDHHYTTGMSTVEMASVHAQRAVKEFETFFRNGRNNPPGEYKTYIIKDENAEKLRSLAKLLDLNGIQYGYGASGTVSGYNYFARKIENVSIGKSDMIISAYQPKAVMVKVLFEPETFVSDSNTYDITAWAMPYAYGLKAYASKQVVKPSSTAYPHAVQAAPSARSLGYIADWNSVADVKFLAELLKRNIRVRYSEIEIQVGGRKFNPGSLIIARTGNDALGAGFDQAVADMARKHDISLFAIQSGFLDKGADLGSNKIRYIKKPRIAVLGGDEAYSLAFGEVWHFFEQQLAYPVSVIRSQDLLRINLSDFDVLIAPDGSYSSLADDKIVNWVRAGGKLIAMENAMAQLAGKKGFSLKVKEEEKKEKDKDLYAALSTYGDRNRFSLSSSIPGAIYRVDLDNTHPLAFGFPNYYYTLKLDDRVYQFMENDWNVGVIKKNNYVTGFAGVEARKRLVDGLLYGVQDMGNGSVVYLADDPLFRSFWENGKLLFSNAVFMVNQ